MEIAGWAIGSVITGFILLSLLASRYRKVGPNEALVKSGFGRVQTVTGGGTFVWPIVQKAELMSLEVMTIDVRTPEVYTEQGVPIQVDGVAQIKIDSSFEAMKTAAEQFLGRGRNELMNVALQTIEGHLRAILGTMKIEDIYKNREQFAQKVSEIAETDMNKMGLKIVSFTLRDIKDQHGYLEALGKPRLAEVKRDAASRESQALAEAQIAQANANRDAQIQSAKAKEMGEVARYSAETRIAEANRDFETKKAEYGATVNQKKAESDLAYDLQRFKTGQAVKKEEISVTLVEKEQHVRVQEMEILRREKELEATVVRPAEAQRTAVQAQSDAEKYKIIAEAQGQAEAVKAQGAAQAEAIKLKGLAEAEVIRQKGFAEAEAMAKKAESWSQYNAAAVTQMFVEMLPELARAVAEPLSKTEKIVIVSSGGGDGAGAGASRITQDVATVMAQLPPVVESLSGIRLEDLVRKIPGMGKPETPPKKG